jgi:hypothetical protein
MKAFKEPTVPPSSKCAIAAITGVEPSVVVQDERGNQVVVTPKMARQLAKELASMADIADGKREPDLTRGFVFPSNKSVL